LIDRRVKFHQQIHVAAARGIIHARTEQPHPRAGAELLGGQLLDRGDVLRVQAHRNPIGEAGGAQVNFGRALLQA
jgi:hypothetical protein